LKIRNFVKMIDSFNKTEKGIAIILALFVLSIVLTIAISVSTILVSELQLGRTAGHSVPAFFAADSGIEKVLTNRNSPASIPETLLGNGAKFSVVVTPAGPGCTADNYCIKSVGVFQGTRRAIEITY